MAYSDEDKEKVTITDVECIGVNPKTGAILCTHETWDENKWVGYRYIDDDSEVYKVGDEGKLIIPKWLAKKANMV
jgi:hypothetical protein